MQNTNGYTSNTSNMPPSQLRTYNDYSITPRKSSYANIYSPICPHAIPYVNPGPASPTSSVSASLISSVSTSPISSTTSPISSTASPISTTSSYRMPSPPIIIVSPDTPYATTPSKRPTTFKKRYYAQKREEDGDSGALSLEKGEEGGVAKAKGLKRRGTIGDLSEKRRSLGGREKIRRLSLKIVGLGR